MSDTRDLKCALKVTIRPATKADFVTFRGEPPVWRTRAWVGEIDGTILGMGGIGYPEGATIPVMWAEFSPDAYRYAKTLHKAGIDFLRTVPERRLVCCADGSIEAARRWAERLGFVASGMHSDHGEVFIYDRHRHPHHDRRMA